MNMNKKMIALVVAGVSLVAIPLTALTMTGKINLSKTIIAMPGGDIFSKQKKLEVLKKQYAELKMKKQVLIQMDKKEVARLQSEKLPYEIKDLQATQDKIKSLQAEIDKLENLVVYATGDGVPADRIILPMSIDNDIIRYSKLVVLYTQQNDCYSNVNNTHRNINKDKPVVSLEYVSRYKIDNNVRIELQKSLSITDVNLNLVKQRNTELVKSKGKIASYEQAIATEQLKINDIVLKLQALDKTPINTEESYLVNLENKNNLSKNLLMEKQSLLKIYNEYSSKLMGKIVIIY